MYKATLIKGRTYSIGGYSFDIENPDMISQAVPDEIANRLMNSDKFLVENITTETKKELKKGSPASRVVLVTHHISKSDGYGTFSHYLMYKYPTVVLNAVDDLKLDSSLNIGHSDITPNDYVIQISAGDLWKDNYKGKCKQAFGYTMFETTKIPQNPKQWTDIINRTCDALIVPAEEVKKVFIAGGINIPVHVVPLWVDDRFVYFKRPKREIFAFLWVGKLDQFNRKGCLDAIEAFEEEFKKESDVRLVIKASNMNISARDSQRIQDNNKIQLINRQFSVEDLNKIYQEADCFLFPTHGEGFGLPPLEAMATGLPTIVTDWMGCREFAKEEICYPIKVDKLEKAIYPPAYGDVGEWAAVDIKRTRKLMRHVYENRKEATEKGIAAAKYVDENFRFKNFDNNLRIAVGFDVRHEVSIILAAKDNVGYLKHCVDSIYKFTPENFELVVIDNGSGVEVKEYFDKLKKGKDNVKVATNKENMGYAYACNQGLKLADGQFICMMDIDTLATPAWMTDMLNCMKKNKDCGIVTPSQSFLEDMNYVPFERNIRFAYIDDDVAEFSKTLKKGRYEEKQIRQIYGYCHLARREVYLEIGGYDWERYKGAAVNETDLFWRAQVKGWKLYWAKGSYVYHFHGVVKKSLGMDNFDMVEKGNAIFSERQKHPENFFVMNNAIV